MQPVRFMRRVTCALVLGSTLGLTIGALPITHAAPAQRQSVYAVLVGTWLGSALGDTGQCGAESGQFTFFRNGEYAYTENSDYIYNPPTYPYNPYTCGGITNAGYYRIRNGAIFIHWTECNYPCAAGTASAGFAFLGRNAFELVDGTRTYVYYRQ